MKKLLITGASGLMGRTLVSFLSRLNHEIYTHSRTGDTDYQSDLADYDSVCSLISTTKPDFIINLSAMTNVDDCEKKMNSAFRANTLSVQNLADAIIKLRSSAFVIHFSSDQVYDNKIPSLENNVLIPNNYALTKYAAEMALSGSPAMVLRTNFFGKSHYGAKKSFTDWIYETVAQSNILTLFDDVYFNPLHMTTICELLVTFIANPKAGVFNLGSRNGMSKAEFGITFLKKLGLSDELVKAVSAEDADMLFAKRPKFMWMNVEKIEKSFGIQMPSLETDLDRCVMEYR